MTRLEKIKEALEHMTAGELVSVHNEYCNNAEYMDDYIYNMEEFDDIMSGQKPWDVARAVCYGDFCAAHDYFWFNGYGNLASGDYPIDRIDIDAIAEYVDDNENDLYCSELAAILEEEAEDDEE